MAEITLHPAKLHGTVTVPPSKSLAHRMIICAALAEGVSHISPIQGSEDILATMDAMRALGADCRLEGDIATITGVGDSRKTEPAEINCRESGSTLRFLVPLSMTVGVGAHFTGAPGLAVRPLTPYQTICAEHGLEYSHAALPELSADVRGKLPAGKYSVPGNISSQFITGLLLALSVADGDSEIVLTTPLESTAYVDLTLDAMQAFGVKADITETGYYIRGGQKYTARDAIVEGDYSQAANWLCAAALGNDVTVAGLNPDSFQGDKGILTVLRDMGATIGYSGGSFHVHADTLRPVEVDVSNIPDIAPVIALTCCFAQGVSRIYNAGRLRIKECDRLTATVQAINAMGGHAFETADEIIVHGSGKLAGGNLCACRNDHRMAMLHAVASTRCEKTLILDSRECVRKSYPHFWNDFAALGGNIE